MVKVQTLSLLAARLQMFGLVIGPHGHSQTGFDGTEYSNESLFEVVVLSSPLNPIFLAQGRTSQINVRPFCNGSRLSSLIANLLAELLGVLGKIFEKDFGCTKVAAKPLGRKQRTQRTSEAQSIVAAQDALDQWTELVGKDSGNVAFGQNRRNHIPAYSRWRAAFPFSAKPPPKLAGLQQTTMPAARFWLRLCCAKKYSG